MAEVLSLQVVMKVIGSLTYSRPAFSLMPIDAINEDFTMTFSNGQGAGQADMLWYGQRTLTESATENIDLKASLLTTFGSLISFATIKGVVIKAAVANVNDVQVTRPAANGAPLFMAAGDGIALGPGNLFTWQTEATGKTVTAGTGDLLTFTNSGGGSSVVYDVFIWGTVG